MILAVTAPLPEEALDALVLVLDEIRLGRSRSRSELVERTRLSRTIVARRVGDLVERGLVVEGSPGPSTGGRPARQLAFNASAGHVLVADLGATSIDVAITTLDGRILAHRDEPSSIGDGAEGVPFASRGAVRPVGCDLARGPGAALGDRNRCAGPGRVRNRPADRAADHARLGRLSHPGAVRRPLRRAGVGRQRREPAGVGRMAPGVAAGHEDVVVVKIGTGIGAGIISGGRIHRGAQGSAGDVGHIQVTDDPTVICRCGNVGCLEALAGGRPSGWRVSWQLVMVDRRGFGRRSSSTVP